MTSDRTPDEEWEKRYLGFNEWAIYHNYGARNGEEDKWALLADGMYEADADTILADHAAARRVGELEAALKDSAEGWHNYARTAARLKARHAWYLEHCKVERCAAARAALTLAPREETNG